MKTNDAETASARFEQAKRRFSDAAVAVLANDPDAGRLARIALAEVECARSELRRLNEDKEA